MDPTTPTELYDATNNAEETLNRNMRFGSEDSRAIIGPSQPGQHVAPNLVGWVRNSLVALMNSGDMQVGST